MSKNNGWKTWLLGALFMIVMGTTGYIVTSMAADVEKLELEDTKQRDSMVAMDKRLSERDYGIDLKLTRLQLGRQVDSIALVEIKADQKEILRILGELR